MKQTENQKKEASIYHHPCPVRLECGVELPGIDIAYHTYGRMNADGSNVVWVMHALTADSEVADWWPHTVESGRFLDPERWYVVCANVLGSCYGTTGPLSVNPATGEPWYDDFPPVTIRDMVECHRLLARHLGIGHVHALIGSSMGGFQAIEWLVREPDFASTAILIATGSFTRPWQAGFNETMRMAIEADSTYGDRSPVAGAAGLAAARAIGLLSYRGRYAYDLTQPDTEPWEGPFGRRVHSYQRHQGRKLVDRFNAYSYHRLCGAVDSHDIARGRGPRRGVLASIKARCLVVAISSDLVFPPEDHMDMVESIPRAGFAEMHSEFAHDGFLIEHARLNDLITGFWDTL